MLRGLQYPPGSSGVPQYRGTPPAVAAAIGGVVGCGYGPGDTNPAAHASAACWLRRYVAGNRDSAPDRVPAAGIVEVLAEIHRHRRAAGPQEAATHRGAGRARRVLVQRPEPQNNARPSA